MSQSGLLNVNSSGIITGGGITWNEVTTTSKAMSVNNGYIANNAALVVLTLPATAAQGSIFRVVGKGIGGWTIAQNAGQQILMNEFSTTSGTGGSLSSTNSINAVELVCITANTSFEVISAIGSPTVV